MKVQHRYFVQVRDSKTGKLRHVTVYGYSAQDANEWALKMNDVASVECIHDDGPAVEEIEENY